MLRNNLRLGSSGRRGLLAGLIASVVFALASAPGLVSSSAMSDGRVTEERGAMALGQAIKRLGVVASVLHTGAHPDDEDSGLLAYLARGRQARTAYLSLTRGDGGQNVIGPELEEQLGVIRTQELLAARRLDGASQFFSRAFDFGFSKSRTETLSKWNREEVLADVVRVIRTFRPLVIVSAWSGTPNDGHGHHQAAGFLTREAYSAAADPNRFPDQMRQGLKPWQAKKLYIRSFDGAATPREFLPSLSTLSINTGQFDPVLGRSSYEIAAQGRSQHRSQGEGTIQARGPRYSRLRLIDSKLGPIKSEKDIFEGIDTSIVGIAAYAGGNKDRLKSLLSDAQAAADEARQKYEPLSPASVSPIIARGLQKIRQARESLSADRRVSDNGGQATGSTAQESDDADFLLREKEEDFVDALAKSEGVVVDCLTDDEVVTPGQTFSVTVASYTNAGCESESVLLSVPSGWTVVQGKRQSSTVDGRSVSQTEFKVTVSRDAEPSEPYWLRKPRAGDMFAISKTVGGSTGSFLTGIEPVAPPVLSAKIEFQAAGQRFEINQQAQFRYADRSVGEIRRDLKVAPAISVSSAPEILVYPISSASQEREVTVSVVNNARDGSRGSIKLETPSGWQVEPSSVPFDLKREGERAAVSFKVRLPRASGESRQELRAVATVGNASYQQGYKVLDYPHIESRFFYSDAATEAEVIDVEVAHPLKVGYIEGAGDDFAAALRRIDVDVTTIDSKELASGDLGVYDTIVSGIRAYEVRPDLVANNSRLLDYVNRGGTYITQYNRGNFEIAEYGPYRFALPNTGSARQRQARLVYVAEEDLVGALAPRAGRMPRIGVVAAAEDPTLQVLRRANVEGTRIDAAMLKSGDLRQFDVIVIGTDVGRARDLLEYNQQLLGYGADKMLLLAYSRAQYISGEFPAYPKPPARPFRTTDETAKVTILEPNHPRFNYPNKITERDFEGWVQERGAYFLGDWDQRYKPLMACHDPGEPDLKGGELIAEYGKGLYVYTAYAWFRQLPKGVPGAYRLIANLVSLPKSRAASSHGR